MPAITKIGHNIIGRNVQQLDDPGAASVVCACHDDTAQSPEETSGLAKHPPKDALHYVHSAAFAPENHSKLFTVLMNAHLPG